MQRSFFQRLLAVAVFAALFSLNACQKDAELTPSTVTPEGIATQRNQQFYGVTVYGGAGNPSRVLQIDQNTGFVIGQVNVVYTLPNNTQLPVTDIRGICYLGNGIKYAITTGPNNPFGVPNNALMTLNVTTGDAYFVSTSTQGTISDIDYDPVSGNIYGLANNTNTLVVIGAGAFNVYTPVAINGLPGGYTCRGLTMIGDLTLGITQINVAMTNGTGGNALVYKVDPNTGTSGYIADLLPAAELANGHCGIGFQLKPASQLFINRNNFNFNGSGLNSLGWPNQGPVGTAVWGAAGFNFEDLSSDVNQ